MSNQINIDWDALSNETIINIVNKLEAKIDLLMTGMNYEFVKLKYQNYLYYCDLQQKYHVIICEMDVNDERRNEYSHIIMYLGTLIIDLQNNNKSDFKKLKKIYKTQSIIKTLKEIDNSCYINEVLKVIKQH